jgi:hypothetical protein
MHVLFDDESALKYCAQNGSTTEAGQMLITQSHLGRENYENTSQAATLVTIYE